MIGERDAAVDRKPAIEDQDHRADDFYAAAAVECEVLQIVDRRSGASLPKYEAATAICREAAVGPGRHTDKADVALEREVAHRREVACALAGLIDGDASRARGLWRSVDRGQRGRIDPPHDVAERGGAVERDGVGGRIRGSIAIERAVERGLPRQPDLRHARRE